MDFEFTKEQKDIATAEIYEGTTEIEKLIVAKSVLA